MDSLWCVRPQIRRLTGPIPGDAYLGGQHSRVSLSDRGYTEEEYFISGTAASYTSDGPMPADGRMTVKPADTAAYTTRILLRRPSDLKKFNGTVLVEWLNVSAGSDGAPDFSFLNRQIVRDGYAWVGVSVQKVGLDGNPAMPAMAKPIKVANPAPATRGLCIPEMPIPSTYSHKREASFAARNRRLPHCVYCVQGMCLPWANHSLRFFSSRM